MGKFDPPSKRVQIDVRLDDVVLRTLEREPARRYQHASEVRSEVETIVQSSGNAAASGGAALRWAHHFPIRYFLLCWAIFAVAWFGALTTWNLRWFGIPIGCGLICVALYGAAALGRRHFPVIAANWKADSRKVHIGRIIAAFARCSLIYFWMINGGYSVFQRLHWDFSFRSPASFEQVYAGKEYQLVRQLSAYEKTVPKVELVLAEYEIVRWWIGSPYLPDGPERGMFNMVGILLQFGIGFFICVAAANALISARPSKSVPWYKRHISILPVSILSMSIAAGWCSQAFVLVAWDIGRPHGVNALRHTLEGADAGEWSETIRVTAPFFRVRDAIEAALEAEGYEQGNFSMWEMKTVPNGKTIGTAGFTTAWKSWAFDRWRWDWRAGRFVASSPQITIQYVTTDWSTYTVTDPPSETNVSIDLALPGDYLYQGTANQIIDRLLAAAKSVQSTTGEKR
jgi:hypothetical protein